MLSWFGAAIIAWFAYPHVADLLIEWLPNALLRSIAGGVISFVVAIIALSFLASFLKALLTPLGALSIDRPLGGVFGLLRGYLITCILFSAAYWIWGDRSPPQFLQQGKTRPFIALGAHEVTLFLVSYENTPLIKRLQKIVETGSDAVTLHEKILLPETEKTSPKTGDTGYKKEDRNALDKLFE